MPSLIRLLHGEIQSLLALLLHINAPSQVFVHFHELNLHGLVHWATSHLRLRLVLIAKTGVKTFVTILVIVLAALARSLLINQTVVSGPPAEC